MINKVKEKVTRFLQDMLDVHEVNEDVRIIGIVKSDDEWIAEAEVVERDRTLPGHRVFKTNRYIVKLNKDLEPYSFRQEKNNSAEEIYEV